MSNLISVPFRHTQPVDNFASKLIDYVTESSQQTHPFQVQQDATQLEQLRNNVYGKQGLPNLATSTINQLLKYYVQLSYTLTKFPDSVSPAFTYTPLFASSIPSNLPPGALPTSTSSSSSTSNSTSFESLSLELISTLSSLASLYTQLSTQLPRTTEQSLKLSIHYFQSSAGIYDRILSLLPCTIAIGNDRRGGGGKGEMSVPLDLKEEVVNCLRDLSLAQAQEVVWQKAVMDRLKNGTISKLAQKVSELYGSTLEWAKQSETLPSIVTNTTASSTSNPERGVSKGWKFPDEWLKYFDLKRSHFAAVAQYRRSLDDLGSNRYGDEIGRLQFASQLLKDTLSSNRIPKGGVLEIVARDLKGLQSIVEENLKRATKDNDLIYLAHPTPPSSLPPIVSFTVAKPTASQSILSPLTYLSNSSDPEGLTLGRPLFEGLVRREVGIVLELWEDRKKEWNKEVERWNKGLVKELNTTLESMSLPSSLDASVQPQGVPSHILDRSNEVVKLGGTERLERMMKDVRKVAKVNEKLLQEASEHLQTESATDTFFRTTHGSMRWTRPPSLELSQPLIDRIDHLTQLVTSARSSDGLVRTKYAEWNESIKVLEGGEVELRRSIPDGSQIHVGEGRDGETRIEAEERRKRQKVERELRGGLDGLRDVEEERKELVRRVENLSSQRDIRDKVLDKAEELARRKEFGSQAGESEEGGGENEVAEFEEVLSRELQRLKAVFDEDMHMNEKRQTDLLDSIKTLNTSFVNLRSSSTESAARRKSLETLSTAHSKFLEMMGNLEEGLKFYADLSRLGSELRDAAKNFAYTRNAEAQQLDAQLSSIAVESTEPAQPDSQEPIEPPVDEPSPPSPAPVSQPPSTATPRRSTRRTAGAAATTPSASNDTSTPRTTRRTVAKKVVPPSEPAPQPRYEYDKEVPLRDEGEADSRSRSSRRSQGEEEEERVGVIEGGAGGWDPSMGIRFG